VNKWFKKQPRTDADARLDKINPTHVDPLPIDTDEDGNQVRVAPPMVRQNLPGHTAGRIRPLKGGYWFIPECHHKEVQEAINRVSTKHNKEVESEHAHEDIRSTGDVDT
jgi:hypothetical protein